MLLHSYTIIIIIIIFFFGEKRLNSCTERQSTAKV